MCNSIKKFDIPFLPCYLFGEKGSLGSTHQSYFKSYVAALVAEKEPFPHALAFSVFNGMNHFTACVLDFSNVDIEDVKEKKDGVVLTIDVYWMDSLSTTRVAPMAVNIAKHLLGTASDILV
jgi:hypothetical protein